MAYKITLAVLLCCIGSLVIPQENAYPQSIMAKKKSFSIFFNEIKFCFNDKINENEIMSTKYTDIFLANAIKEEIRDFIMNDFSKFKYEKELVRNVCKRVFNERFLPAYNLAKKEREEVGKFETNEALANLGYMPIEHSNVFIEKVNNWFLTHDAGHADITRTALLRLPETKNFSESALRMVIQGSQGPDLFLWNEHLYHAHTDEYEKENRLDVINASRTGFINLVRKLLDDARRLAMYPKQQTAEALYTIGMACHAMQDLVYHQGMTMRQHSGLAYSYEGRNPDLPPCKGQEDIVDQKNGQTSCKDRRNRWNEAVRVTLRTLELAESFISPSSWKTMISWNVEDKHALNVITKKFFNDQEQMTFDSLFEYWWMSVPYTIGERNLSELNDHIAKWDIGKTINEIVHR